MLSKKNKYKSLSEIVTENLNRNLNASHSDSDNETGPKIIDFDEEEYQQGEANKVLGQIRKQNVKLLSEQSSKYCGEIASRKELYNSDDDSNANDSDSESGNNGIEEADSLDEPSDSIDESDDDGNDSVDKDQESSDENLVSAKNNKLETEKGMCVQNQLAVWEKLLEIRIHSQKMINKANSLPCPESFAKLAATKVYSDAAQETRQNAEQLLEKLLETQVNLANQFSEIKKLEMCNRKRNHSKSKDSLTPSSKRFAVLIESNFEKFKPYRNSVLLKWDDRTKLLASTTSNKRKHAAEEFDIIKKVDNILQKRDDHIANSQKVKGNYKLFGQEQSESDDKTEVSNPNVYDDTEFYHSQLRELIEFKSNVSSNAYDITKQFAELQKLRQKMKKKVDTRASKGRKIRYVVHHKLVNFMAPNNTSDWTEESKNELYRSLFVT